jgi:glycosyltransferase involved in cell wall biosynthesis
MSGSSKLRLLAYTDSETIGGAELVLSYLLGALSREIEVGVLAVDARVAEAIVAGRPGTPVFTVRPPGDAGARAALREHVRAVRAFAPDVLHANQAWPWACGYGELAGLLTPGTRVLAVDHLPLASAVPRARRVGRWILARRLHAHVAVGKHSAREVEEVVGLPRGSVGAIPNGVPVEGAEASPTRVERVEKGSAVKGETVIGSLGRLAEQKRYDLLVRALPGLPGAQLVLVGDGPERAALESLASELGVAERLTITGWVEDARARLRGFDVFALPSDWEGMPLGILEAMHAGLPVLATDVGSVAEALADGETGYLVPAGDLGAVCERLERLLGDSALRTRMGARARTVALERFTDGVMAARYESIYSDMTGRRACSAG